jgi:uncharacterized tellurite resistance protein B-like protein
MSLENFSEPQKRALIDLVVLSMYADGHLALRESASLQKTLESLGFAAEYDRDREVDASISRVRAHAGNKEDSARYARASAQAFGSPEDRELVQKLLQNMMASDEKVTPEEETFMKSVASLFSAK